MSPSGAVEESVIINLSHPDIKPDKYTIHIPKGTLRFYVIFSVLQN